MGGLAVALFGSLLAVTATAPGVEPWPLLMLGLANSLLFGLSLWLNRTLEAVVAGAPEVPTPSPVPTHPAADPRIDRLALGAGLGLGLAVVLMGVGLLLLWQEAERALLKDRMDLNAGLLAARVADLLDRGEHLTWALSNQHLESIASQQDFERRVGDILALAGAGMTLQWAPGAVVRYFMPLAGNEGAIGHDLLADPDRRPEVEELLASGQPHWAGPYPLVQGGLGLLYRIPVGAAGKDPPAETSQGIAITLLRFPQALAPLIPQTPDADFRVWIGTGDEPPLQVWGAESPGPTSPAEGELMGLARVGPGPAQSQGHPEIASSPVSALRPPPRIKVAVRPQTPDPSGQLPARFQALVIAAALLGWVASNLIRNRLQRQLWRRQEVEFTEMRAVLDHSQIGKVLIAGDGQVLWANRRASEVLHAAHGQILTVNLFSNPLFLGQGWDAVARSVLADGQERVLEYEGQGTVGQPLDIRMTFNRVLIAGQAHLLEEILDLSGIHGAQAALRQSEARFRQLFEEAPDAFFIAECEGLRFSDCNRAALTLLRGTREQILGLNPIALSPPLQPDGRTSQEAAATHVADLGRDGRARFEWLPHRCDGSRFMADLQVVLIQLPDRRAYLATCSDISVIKDLQQDLADSNARLERLVRVRTQALQQSRLFSDSLLDTMSSVFVLLDVQGHVQRFNQAAQRLTGYRFEELRGKPIWDFLIPPEVQGAVRGLFDDLTHDRLTGYFENEWLIKDGGRRLFGWHNSVLHDAAGQVTHILAIGLDITEQRGNEIELEGHRRHLEELVAARTEEIQETSRRLELATQAAGIGIWQLDLDTGLGSWDSRLCDLYGLDPEVQGRPIEFGLWRDRIHPDDIEAVEADWRAMVEAGEAGIRTKEFRIIRPDGGVRHVEDALLLFKDEAGRPVRALGINRDITERKEGQAALLENESRLRQVMEATQDGIWDWDLASDLAYLSPRYYHMTGYGEGEVTANLAFFTKLIHPDDRDQVMATMQDCLTGKTAISRIEYRMITRSGALCWIKGTGKVIARAADGTPLRMLGSISDITEQRQLRQRYLMLFERSPDAYLLVDDASGTLVAANEAACRLFASTRVQLLGLNLLRISPPLQPDGTPSPEAILPIIATCLHQGSHQFEWVHRRLTGSDFWAEVSVQTLQLDGRLSAFIALRDISTRKQLESDLRAARETAEQAAAAKGEFLSTMSHEIRTPLGGVTGLLQLLAGTRLNETQAGYVAKAQRSAQLLLNILNDILDFSRLEEGRVEIAHLPFQLSREVQGVTDILAEAAARKGLALSVTQPSECPAGLVGDALRLQQVLLNLGNNAIKFTERGAVEIRVACAPGAGDRLLLRCEVQDTGIGIHAAQRERIFERFSQGETGMTRRFGGSSLGLAIAKGLVGAMGGEIGVSSEPGQGSLFWFEVPLEQVREASDAQADPYPAVPAIPRAGLRVLVVEDHDINQLVLQGLLGQLGAEVTLAGNGREAVDQVLLAHPDPGARERPTGPRPFDLVLMDVQMPVLDGLAATRLLRQWPHLAKLLILAISAGILPNERERCLAAGMNDFLAKPIALEELGRALLRHGGPAEPLAAGDPGLAWPSPPGFDLGAAIDRLGGNVATWLRLSRLFLAGLDGALTDLRHNLRAESPEAANQATKQLHRLRGGALTLGADGFAQVLRALETALTAGGTLDREALIAELEAATEGTRTALLPLIEGRESGGDRG